MELDEGRPLSLPFLFGLYPLLIQYFSGDASKKGIGYLGLLMAEAIFL